MKRNGKRVDVTKEMAARIEHARSVANISINELHRRTGMQVNTYNKIQNLKQNTISESDLDELSKAMECGRMWLETGEGAISDKDYLAFSEAKIVSKLADIYEFESSNLFAKFDPDFFAESRDARYFMYRNLNSSFEKNQQFIKINQHDVLIMKETNKLEYSGIYLLKFGEISLIRCISIDVRHDLPLIYNDSDHGEFGYFDKERLRIIGVVVCAMKNITKT
jgi:transcriptional regulator with XRE-family HTH domain